MVFALDIKLVPSHYINFNIYEVRLESSLCPMIIRRYSVISPQQLRFLSAFYPIIFLLSLAKHCFSQIIICGDCGEMFRRIHWNNRGCKSIVWRCISRLEPTGLECHARTINELDLQEIVLTALNELLGDKSKYQKQLQQNIASVIRASAVITTDGIDEKLMELRQELVKKANNKEAYDEIADQIFTLRKKRQQASMDTVQRDEQLQRITELQDFIKNQPSDPTVFDEALVKRWLKQITIWDDLCTVELKSGLKVDVEK